MRVHFYGGPRDGATEAHNRYNDLQAPLPSIDIGPPPLHDPKKCGCWRYYHFIGYRGTMDEATYVWEGMGTIDELRLL